MYFKIIYNNSIIGIASEDNFRKYQSKHNVILVSSIDDAQYVAINDTLYRDDWLKKITNTEISYVNAIIQRISQEEYEILKESFEIEEEIPVEDEPIEEDEPIYDEEDTSLDFIKSLKIKSMSNMCHNTIVNGFDIVLSDGENHHFSLTIEDQIKIQTLAMKAQNGEQLLPWHSDGELCVFFPAEDILQIYAELEKLQTYHTTYFNSLKYYISSMNTIEEVNQVQYGMDIPEEYQSEVLKYLLEQNNEDSI